jgi:hypothetical protein
MVDGKITLKEARSVIKRVCGHLGVEAPTVETLEDASILDGEFTLYEGGEPVIRLKKLTTLGNAAHELLHYLLYLIRKQAVDREVTLIDELDNLEERLIYMLEDSFAKYLEEKIYKRGKAYKGGGK